VEAVLHDQEGKHTFRVGANLGRNELSVLDGGALNYVVLREVDMV